MFKNLADRINQSVKHLTGQAKITEDNVKDTLREIRVALLEADVALPVVTEFTGRVRTRAMGTEVLKSLSPGQVFIKVVQDELTEILGSQTAELKLDASPPVVILLAGLQGAGKTTTAAKLARLLKDRYKKKVMMVSADVYRPAAIEQLRVLADQVEVAFVESTGEQDPVDIATRALTAARQQFADVLLIDTAGRLAVDQAMMDEVSRIHQATSPTETLFVVDSMTGQDAANTARAFGDVLPLTGVVLTKTDGDARGGSALSVRMVTGKPIKFIGVGEKIDDLELFHPERIAQRILGMGDVASLVEEVQRKVDHEQAEKLAKKVSRGKKFDFDDFRVQLEQMQNMGGMSSLLDKLPGMGNLSESIKSKVDDREVTRMMAMINSMTPKERRFPNLITQGSRKRRIIRGSGTQIQDLNKMVKQFNQMQKMMKKMGKGGAGMAGMMKKLQGKLPPGGFPGM